MRTSVREDGAVELASEVHEKHDEGFRNDSLPVGLEIPPIDCVDAELAVVGEIVVRHNLDLVLIMQIQLSTFQTYILMVIMGWRAHFLKSKLPLLLL